MNQRPKYKTKTIKPLEENVGVNLVILELGKPFLDIAHTAQVRRDQIDESDFIKIKNICAANDTSKKVKRQPTE